jgi:hypothetical protein
MGTNGYGAWNSVGDQGGLSAITSKGAALAQANGIDGSGTPQTSGDFPAGQSDASLPNTTPGGNFLEAAPTDAGQPGGVGSIGGGGSFFGLGGGNYGAAGADPSGVAGTQSGDVTAGGTQDFMSGGQAQSFDQGSGVPVVITDISGAGGKGAGPQIQKGLETAGKNVQDTGAKLDSTLNQDTGQVTSTGTGWLQYLANLWFDAVPRIGLGLLALIIVLLGFWMIGRQQRIL